VEEKKNPLVAGSEQDKYMRASHWIVQPVDKSLSLVRFFNKYYMKYFVVENRLGSMNADPYHPGSVWQLVTRLDYDDNEFAILSNEGNFLRRQGYQSWTEKKKFEADCHVLFKVNVVSDNENIAGHF